MFFPTWDLRACAFISRYRLLDGILNPYLRSVQKGCYRNFKCGLMGVLRLSSALVSSKFAIQSYKLTNLSQKYAQKRVIVAGCNPFQVPMTTSPLCYENMFQVWYAWVWCLMPQCMLYDCYEFPELASWVQSLSRAEITAEIDLK